MYKIKNLPNDSIAIMRFNSDGTTSGIPVEPLNSDYKEYLEWLEKGNEPLPPD